MDFRTSSATIHIPDLYQADQRKMKVRLNIYNKILKTIYRKIKLKSNKRNCIEKWIIFEVPSFIYGMPKIKDKMACKLYLIQTLKKNSFRVELISQGDLLFISWQHFNELYSYNVMPNEYIQPNIQNKRSNNFEKIYENKNDMIINESEGLKDNSKQKQMANKYKFDFLKSF